MRMLYWPCAFTQERLEAIAGQRRQVAQGSGGLQTVELHARGAIEPSESLHAFSGGEIPGPLVPEADDHAPKVS